MTKTDFKVYNGIKVEFNVGDLDKTNIIYKLTFPNGKIYIGQTSQTLRRRLTRHCCENEDTFKCRVINKYKSFNCEILYQGEDLDNQEIEFISITEAARYYDCNNANIIDVLNNRLKTFKKKQYTAKYK